jgi:hypothetical protein
VREQNFLLCGPDRYGINVSMEWGPIGKKGIFFYYTIIFYKNQVFGHSKPRNFSHDKISVFRLFFIFKPISRAESLIKSRSERNGKMRLPVSRSV